MSNVDTLNRRVSRYSQTTRVRAASFSVTRWLVLLSLIVVSGVAHAAGGSLDTSFGSGGRMTTSFGTNSDGAFDVAVQSDGNIVVAGGTNGYLALARYTTTGQLDTGFGVGGTVTTNVIGAASAIAIQRDGKLVVVGSTPGNFPYGSSEGDFVVARFNPNGSLDATFGTAGRVETDFSYEYKDNEGKTQKIKTRDLAYGVALQVLNNEEKIVVVGVQEYHEQRYVKDSNGAYYWVNFHVDSEFAIARYNLDGSLDTSFDRDGKLTVGYGLWRDVAYDVAIQDCVIDVDVPDCPKIVIVGRSIETQADFSVVRLLPNGLPDPAFGIGGKVRLNLRVLTNMSVYPPYSPRISGSTDVARAVALQPDGKIAVAGYTLGSWPDPPDPCDRWPIEDVDCPLPDADPYLPDPSGFAVVRLLPAGIPDPEFNTAGILLDKLGNYNFAHDLVIQSDGKIVVAGTVQNGYNAPLSCTDFALVRLLPSGDRDKGFGVDGKVLTDFGTTSDKIEGLALQRDGKLVAAGSSQASCNPNYGYDFAVARYLP